MKYIFLSQQFYTDYNSKQFSEIEHKVNRPYIMLLVQIEGVTFAVPFRSHISHKYAFITAILHKTLRRRFLFGI